MLPLFHMEKFRTCISTEYVFPTIFSRASVFGLQAAAFLQPDVSPVSPPGPCCSVWPLESLTTLWITHFICMDYNRIRGTFLCKVARNWPEEILFLLQYQLRNMGSCFCCQPGTCQGSESQSFFPGEPCSGLTSLWCSLTPSSRLKDLLPCGFVSRERKGRTNLFNHKHCEITWLKFVYLQMLITFSCFIIQSLIFIEHLYIIELKTQNAIL